MPRKKAVGGSTLSQNKARWDPVTFEPAIDADGNQISSTEYATDQQAKWLVAKQEVLAKNAT